MEIMKTLDVPDREEWRAWLEQNHAVENEIWLIAYKKGSGKSSVPYEEAVEEALCFGWIDSLVKKIDDESYAQKFSRRKDAKKWSESNLRRLRKLAAEGKMTPAGWAVIDPEVLEKVPQPMPEGDGSVPEFIETGLKANPPAWDNFNRMATSYQNMYLRWILSAKKNETRQKRLSEAADRLKQNLTLGLR